MTSMNTWPVEGRSGSSQLLAAFPATTQKRLAPHLRLIRLELGDALQTVGTPGGYVYFPNNAVISLLRLTREGKSAEISVVGCEGVVGTNAFMGQGATCTSAMVSARGTAYRLSSQLLGDAFVRDDAARVLLLGYTQVLLAQMSQTAVCFRHHSVEQQLCRRLLLSLDRMAGCKIMLTQQLLAEMLGVRREGITQAIGTLRELGAIQTRRGSINVVSRRVLEQRSCECYNSLLEDHDQALPYSRMDAPRAVRDGHCNGARPALDYRATASPMAR